MKKREEFARPKEPPRDGGVGSLPFSRSTPYGNFEAKKLHGIDSELRHMKRGERTARRPNGHYSCNALQDPEFQTRRGVRQLASKTLPRTRQPVQKGSTCILGADVGIELLPERLPAVTNVFLAIRLRWVQAVRRLRFGSRCCFLEDGSERIK